MPSFDGTDPDGWILRAERYFGIYQLKNDEKIEAVMLCLSGVPYHGIDGRTNKGW